MRDDDDWENRNTFRASRDLRRVAGEEPVAVVKIGRGGGVFVRRIYRGCERELRVPPGEFPVVQFGDYVNAVASVGRNLKAEVRRVRCAGRNEVGVNGGPRGPGIAFVDGIAVRIDQQRTVEMRAGIDGAFAFVGGAAAPEDYAAFVVSGGKFEPAIEGVHRAARKEVAHLARAYDDIEAVGAVATNGSGGAVERSGELAYLGR